MDHPNKDWGGRGGNTIILGANIVTIGARWSEQQEV